MCANPNPLSLVKSVYIITEYTAGGIFLQFLKEQGNDIKKRELCRMCIDVCKVINMQKKNNNVLSQIIVVLSYYKNIGPKLHTYEVVTCTLQHRSKELSSWRK